MLVRNPKRFLLHFYFYDLDKGFPMQPPHCVVRTAPWAPKKYWELFCILECAVLRVHHCNHVEQSARNVLIKKCSSDKKRNMRENTAS